MRTKSALAANFIAVIFALGWFGAQAGISAQTDAARRGAIFEEVWTTISEKYYDARFNGVDWKAVGEKYRARLKSATGDTEFYAILDRMAGELRDSHTRVFSPDQREARKKQKRASAGLQIKLIEKMPVIASVAPGTEAERLGIRPGMIVSTVNGRPVGQALKQARIESGVSSSKRSTAMRVHSKLLAGEPGTLLRIGLLNEKGRLQDFTLRRISVSSAPQTASRLLPSGVAYLKFSAFDEALENEIAAALENFKDAPALIVDLRGNPGGDGEIGLRFAGRFFAGKITVAKIVTRTGRPPVEGMPMTLETENKSGRFFSGPVAVLIDERTASTAELISNALQETARARIFGINSCGCVLAFLDYKPLTGGGDMTLSEFGFVTPKNRRIEGAGVKPDRIVRPTLEDIRTGRDAALAEAEKYLENLLED